MTSERSEFVIASEASAPERRGASEAGTGHRGER